MSGEAGPNLAPKRSSDASTHARTILDVLTPANPIRVALIGVTILWLASLAICTDYVYDRIMSEAFQDPADPKIYRIKTSRHLDDMGAWTEFEMVTEGTIRDSALATAITWTAPPWMLAVVLLAIVRYRKPS
jgi:hypothetical protein